MIVAEPHDRNHGKGNWLQVGPGAWQVSPWMNQLKKSIMEK